MRRLFVTALLFTMTAPAMAQEIPRYDPEVYCERISQTAGGSSRIYNSCIEMEQAAYNTQRDGWDELPENTRSYCDRIGQTAGGSYRILQSCVEMETEATDTTPAFQF